MKLIKNILILTVISFFCSNAFSEIEKENCAVVKNLAKKIECKLKNSTKVVTSKVDAATEGITSKKSLADFFKKKEK